MSRAYEWVVEEVNADEDIVETDAYPTAAAALTHAHRRPAPGCRFDVGLVLNIGDDDRGLQDRQWAYIDDAGFLPEQFDGGARVPQRFAKELEAIHFADYGIN